MLKFIKEIYFVNNMVDHDKVKNEAKQIMDNFMESLKDIEVEEDFVLERKESYRDEQIKIDNTIDNDDFKNIFLSNASNTKGDAILANKGDWV